MGRREMKRRPYVPIAERVKDLTSDFKDNKIYSTQLTRQIDKHGSVIQVEELNPREYIYRQPQKEVYCARIGPYTDNETLRNRNNEARQRNKSYMDQMFADQLAARKIFQDALNTRAHIQQSGESADLLAVRYGYYYPENLDNCAEKDVTELNGIHIPITKI